jgi:uncharacterized peroxidase-related enzyme
MVEFVRYRIENAPEESKSVLKELQQDIGFVPELFGYIAESPETLSSYFSLAKKFARCSLSPTEQRVLLLAISVENGCEYCVAAHSVIAKELIQVCPTVVEAIRSGQTIPDARLRALVEFTLELKAGRGHINHAKIDAFLQAGFTKQNVFEVIMALSMKTLSNYANLMIGADVDEEFAHEAWEKE